MKFSADDFRLRYADMPDGELLSLDPRELTDVARQCWEGEMARRGLRAKAPERRPLVDPLGQDFASRIPEPEPGTPEATPELADEREEEELAPAAVFRSRTEASAARGRLQAAFIPTFLENDEPASEWTPRSTSGSFRLLVPASYLAQAREILSGE